MFCSHLDIYQEGSDTSKTRRPNNNNEIHQLRKQRIRRFLPQVCRITYKEISVINTIRITKTNYFRDAKISTTRRHSKTDSRSTT